jgi:hypothetical protein
MTHTGGNSDDPMRIAGVTRTPRTGGAEAVAPADAEATQGIAASGSAAALASTDAIADALANGAIDAAEARAQLIEQSVRAQLPTGADPALVAEVRAQVEALLQGDPLLESLLRST